MVCKYCGHEIREGAKFCTNCGKKVEEVYAVEKQRKADLLDELFSSKKEEKIENKFKIDKYAPKLRESNIETNIDDIETENIIESKEDEEFTEFVESSIDDANGSEEEYKDSEGSPVLEEEVSSRVVEGICDKADKPISNNPIPSFLIKNKQPESDKNIVSSNNEEEVTDENIEVIMSEKEDEEVTDDEESANDDIIDSQVDESVEIQEKQPPISKVENKDIENTEIDNFDSKEEKGNKKEKKSIIEKIKSKNSSKVANIALDVAILVLTITSIVLIVKTYL